MVAGMGVSTAAVGAGGGGGGGGGALGVSETGSEGGVASLLVEVACRS